jgi:ligand-binding SRPBCC domain-containing protein
MVLERAKESGLSLKKCHIDTWLATRNPRPTCQSPSAMNTEQLERAQYFPRPVEDVWEFFSDIDNLNQFTPAYFQLKVLTPERPALFEGQMIDYTLSLFGIPFRWTTDIEKVEYPKSFVDIQSRGPYRIFRHTHEFWSVEGGTLMIDRLEFDVGWGPVGWLAQRLVVRPLLNRIFEHRRQACAALLANDGRRD